MVVKAFFSQCTFRHLSSLNIKPYKWEILLVLFLRKPCFFMVKAHCVHACVCVTHHTFMSDRLCAFPGYSRDRLRFNCFVLRESIAHCALMLPISSLIILPLIWAVAEMAGSCVFLYLRLLINNLFIHTADKPQTDFLIKVLIQFVSESPVWTVQLLSCMEVML